MITSLSIENFALIDKLSIDFTGGFLIITGETGAGKSILLGALGLVLGKRADLSALKNKDQKCVIEAHFSIADYDLQDFFSDNDLDYEDFTIIRREILPSGKSRAFVNDSPVNLQQLQELGDFLIDIHSQHQTRELSEEDFQFKIIDAIAANQPLLVEYKTLLTSYKKNKSVLASLNTQLLEATKEHDYNTFLLDELLVANLKAGQQEELESLYEQLSNVELIRENLDKSLALANEDQYGILSNLREAKSAIQKVSAFSPEYNQLLERITSTAIELDDIFDDVSRLSEQLVQDPQQLELTGQKLQTIYNLQKKHQVNTVDELLEVQEALDNQALSAGELESQISLLQNTIAESQLHLDKLALQINESRTAAIPVMSARLIEILSTLGMPNVRFDIKITSSEQYFQNGKDELQFLFSANKGSDFGLLKKVASGGEMSRIMLAVKAILAQYSKLPTIIFDEIDTGVSGEIAHKMGDIMKSMSTDMQVFAITHLPQIAAKGHTHYKVFKSVSGERTNSELKLLTNEERVNEIAQMLSGSVISDSAINHAKALLD